MKKKTKKKTVRKKPQTIEPISFDELKGIAKCLHLRVKKSYMQPTSISEFWSNAWDSTYMLHELCLSLQNDIRDELMKRKKGDEHETV